MARDSSDGRSRSTAVTAWTDPERWAHLRTPAGCPFCAEDPRGVRVDLPATRVLIPRTAPLPGYVCVVSKRHVVEPFELEGAERAQFWEDVLRSAEAVASVVQPVKVNYEIHGNTIPHLHVHVFPRFAGDPFERGPIDPRAAGPLTRTDEEIERLRAAIDGWAS